MSESSIFKFLQRNQYPSKIAHVFAIIPEKPYTVVQLFEGCRKGLFYNCFNFLLKCAIPESTDVITQQLNTWIPEMAFFICQQHS